MTSSSSHLFHAGLFKKLILGSQTALTIISGKGLGPQFTEVIGLLYEVDTDTDDTHQGIQKRNKSRKSNL